MEHRREARARADGTRCGPWALLACVAFWASGLGAAEDLRALAEFVKATSGVEQGLCLAVDAPAELVAELAKTSRMYVQGCTWDVGGVAAGRAALQKAGVAGRAALIPVEVEHLPYADNLINVVVCPQWGRKPVALDEVLRVLAPGGTGLLGSDANAGATAGLEAKLKQAGVTEVKALARKGWLAFVKPVPVEFGTWTHNFGGPDLSYIGDDRAAGPWEELRWVGDPRWGALAGTYSGRVTSGGRYYYAEQRSDHAWWVARDAYNGTELWRFPLVGKGWVPLHGPGNTLASDERWAYATHNETLTARDGKTGAVAMEYKLPLAARNITPVGTHLLVSNLAKNIANFGSAAAVEKATGKVLWQKPAAAHPPSEGGVAFVLGAADLEGVEIATGTVRWTTPLPKADGFPRVFCKAGIVYVVTTPNWKPHTQLAAFDAKSGALLWSDKTQCAKASAMLPVGTELCLTIPSKPNKITVLDGKTGAVAREMPVGNFSGKCYGFTGNTEYLSYGWGDWLQVKTGAETNKKTLRSACFLGCVFANGLTYFLPHHCDCGVTLRGMLALSVAGKRKWLTDEAQEGSPRLFASGAPPAPAAEGPGDWPMYRLNAARSNATEQKLPVQVKLLWSQKLGDTALTQATAAYGLVFAAEPKTHRVFARDAASGKEVWSFLADGRVEYPPSLHKGLCLFGTGGGSVYALDARTGQEVWRLRAAPTEKYIAEEGQFASAWPVIGGVLPLNGEIFFTCGRSVGVDGGLFMFAVDAASGKIRWRKRGGTSGGDFFLSDGKDLYLTKTSYKIANGERILGGKAATTPGLLRTTAYLSPVSVCDYMACVEPALSHQKHVELTDGNTTGENLAFNASVGVAAWRYRFGVPPDLMKKDLAGKRFLYARNADKSIRWRMDEGFKLQMLGVVLAGEHAYMAGVPTEKDSAAKSELWVLGMGDGKTLQALPLDGKPVYDGLSTAGGRLYLSHEDGTLCCFGAP
ncbi:MAG: PQQ-binding-like beta-propeller repeat protein [Planctomycetes bacterium]|nr:PQQ-binding-like beta-propeller repeat protein [Planctomycetota bacterium]